MRLSQPLYESVPIVYAVIGAAGIFIGYLDPDAPRSSIALGIGLVCEIAALTIYLRRRDYRDLSREYSGETIELPSRLPR
jgi:hypothetical protein